MEEAEEPGSVGDRRGWAARDSWELLRAIEAPTVRERELGAKRPLSRLEVMVYAGSDEQVAESSALHKLRFGRLEMSYISAGRI